MCASVGVHPLHNENSKSLFGIKMVSGMFSAFLLTTLFLSLTPAIADAQSYVRLEGGPPLELFPEFPQNDAKSCISELEEWGVDPDPKSVDYTCNVQYCHDSAACFEDFADGIKRCDRRYPTGRNATITNLKLRIACGDENRWRLVTCLNEAELLFTSCIDGFPKYKN